MSVRVGLICTLLSVAALTACGGDGDDDGKPAAAASRPDYLKGYENPPMHARVEITPRGYRPKHTKVLLGGTVTFVNLDKRQSHTAETKDLPGGDDDPEAVTDNNEFDTHTLMWEEPYTITFHKPEKVAYFDSLSNFKGTVDTLPKIDLTP